MFVLCDGKNAGRFRVRCVDLDRNGCAQNFSL